MKKTDISKITYFLRGLGIGIIVTCLILVIHNGREEVSSTDSSLTREEIIEKAKEFGLVEPIDNKLDKIYASEYPSISPKVSESEVTTKAEKEK